MASTKVAICIPTIPGRAKMLDEAVKSVRLQKVQPGVEVEVFVAHDPGRTGAWATRNAALQLAREWEPDWVGYLDDDDTLYDWHVQTLLEKADEHDAQIVWGWFEMMGSYADPFPGHRLRQFDPENYHVFPICYMAKADLVYNALDHMGGFQPEKPGNGGAWDVQDLPIVLDMVVRQGAKTHACGIRTWKWNHHGRNTSGMPDKNPRQYS